MTTGASTDTMPRHPLPRPRTRTFAPHSYSQSKRESYPVGRERSHYRLSYGSEGLYGIGTDVRLYFMVWSVGSRMERPRKIARMLLTFATNPIQVGRALPGELVQWRDRGGKFLHDQVDESWEERFHGLLGAPWPCPAAGLLTEVLSDIGTRLDGAGLGSGRFTYAYYSDAEYSLCRAAWCAVAHVKPEVAIETGVAHGVSSRVMLEGLRHNGSGRLWSIDLPFPFDHRLHGQTGAAVTDECRPLWTYLEGTSRTLLPRLVGETRHAELFVHDSLHTARNTLFEMEQIAKIMPAGGVMIIDDIGSHRGFVQFIKRHPEYQTIVCDSDDSEGLFGIAVRT